MAARFILIQLPRRPKVADERIRPVLNKARDWMQVSPNTWVVWTTSSPERWYSRLSKVFGEETRMLICGIDPDVRHGFMPKALWAFLDGKGAGGAAKAL